MMDLLIGGTGCSGTTYIATVLQKCGADVQWEDDGDDGTASWHHIKNIGQYRRVILQLRDPRKACTGVAARWESYIWERSAKLLKPAYGDVYERPWDEHAVANAVKHCWYVLDYTLKAASWVYRVEALDLDRLRNLLHLCGVEAAPETMKSALETVSTNTSSKKGYHNNDYLSWRDITACENGEALKQLTEYWGYRV